MASNDGWEPSLGEPLDEDLERRIEEERDWEGQEEARQDADRPDPSEWIDIEGNVRFRM